MEMINLDKIYYINLKEKTDRNEHFLQQCKLHNIPDDKIIRYEAINGNTHIFTKSELDLFKNVDFNTKFISAHKINKKRMGNQLSHMNILLDMKKNNYQNIMICQDDVIFKNDLVNYINNMMKNVPENCEIINLGIHNIAHFDKFIPYDLNNNNKDMNIIKNEITEHISEYNIWNNKTGYRVNPASLCYIVTQKGCENYLDFNIKNGFTHETDWNMNLYLQSKNIFYGSTHVLATGNNKFPSDIFVKNIPIYDLVDINRYYTDKNTTHSYYEVYDKLFSPIRNTAKNVLEVGIGDFHQKNGGSLILWKLYFENAKIHGVDIISDDRVYDVIHNEKKIITYTKTNAYSFDFIQKLKNDNLKFEVIIDDGPHTFESQCKFIDLYLDLLTEKGMLIIEDIPDMERVNIFIRLTPEHLRPHIQVYDLRKNKGRFDDIIFVIAMP